MAAETPYATWENRAYERLKQAMRSRQVTYKDLARRLTQLGIDESPDQLNRKVNRKQFSAAFFLACLQAMEVDLIAAASAGTPARQQSAQRSSAMTAQLQKLRPGSKS